MPLLFIKKSPISIKSKYPLFYSLMFILIQTFPVSAANNIKQVELSSLGSFEAIFSEVQKVELMNGQNLIGETRYMAGEN